MPNRALCVALIALTLAPAARAGTFEPEVFLDRPAEIAADPEAPIAIDHSGLIAHWHGKLIHLRSPSLILQGTLRLDDRPTALIFSDNGRFLISGHADGSVHLFLPVPNARPSWTARLDSPVRTLAGSPGSALLAVLTDEELVLLTTERKVERGRLKATRGVYAGFPTASSVGLVEPGKVTFAPLTKQGMDLKKTSTVKVKAKAACALPKWKALLVSDGNQVRLVQPKSKKAKTVAGRKAAGTPVTMAVGTHVLALASKGGQTVRFLDGTKRWARTGGELALKFRTVGAMAVSPRDGILYCALARDGGARLDAVVVRSGSLRQSNLPGDALAHGFASDGALHCLLPRDEETPKASVARLRFDPEAGALEELGRHPGELLRHARTRFLLRRGEGLVLVDRLDGKETPLAPPADLVGLTPSPLGDLILFSDDADEHHTAWDPEKKTVVGSWQAPSWRHLALTPDRERVLILRERTLRCAKVSGEELWSETLPRGAPRVELDPSIGAALVPGVGVYDLDDGSQRFPLTSPGARLSAGGAVLIDQENRTKVRGQLCDPGDGKARHAFRFAKTSGGRVRSGLEVLDASPDDRWALVRRHGSNERGLWLYQQGD